MQKPPTERQLTYLRSLAIRAGQTFATPRTAAAASIEIRRLRDALDAKRGELSIAEIQTDIRLDTMALAGFELVGPLGGRS